MKKTINKLVSLVMVIMMVLSLSLPSIAVFSNDLGNDGLLPNYIEAIEDSICDIAFEKELYGFEHVDLSGIWIGESIPTFEVKNGHLHPLDNATYYPLLDESGTMVSMAYVSEIDGDCYTTISSELVNVLYNYGLEEMDAFALIYDDQGVYIWNGEDYSRMLEYGEVMESRSSISAVSDTEISFARVSGVSKMVKVVIDDSIMLYGDDDESAFVNVPKKLQSKSQWCWAACMASMIEHEKGGNYSSAQIAANHVDGENVGATINEVRTWFREYGLNYRIGDANNLLTVLNSLGRNHPIFAGGNGPTSNHAVVLRGIDFGGGSGYISVMDPASASYSRGTIYSQSGNTGLMAYYSGSTGVPYMIVEYLYQ